MKIQKRQSKEIKALEIKIENRKQYLMREKNNKLNEIELKYKNKGIQLEREQKAERDRYERIISASSGNKIIKSLSIPKNKKI